MTTPKNIHQSSQFFTTWGSCSKPFLSPTALLPTVPPHRALVKSSLGGEVLPFPSGRWGASRAGRGSILHPSEPFPSEGAVCERKSLGRLGAEDVGLAVWERDWCSQRQELGVWWVESELGWGRGIGAL